VSIGPHHVFVHFETEAGVPLDEFKAWATEHGLVFADDIAGRNVWRKGKPRMGVEVTFGNGARGSAAKPDSGPPDQAEHVMLTTDWGGPRQADLAVLARTFWVRFGGAMFADGEAREAICNGSS
jgi:hypothetical protein